MLFRSVGLVLILRCKKWRIMRLIHLPLMGLDLCWQLSSLNLVAKILYLGFVISHHGKFWVPFRLICGGMVDLVK